MANQQCWMCRARVLAVMSSSGNTDVMSAGLMFWNFLNNLVEKGRGVPPHLDEKSHEVATADDVLDELMDKILQEYDRQHQHQKL